MEEGLRFVARALEKSGNARHVRRRGRWISLRFGIRPGSRTKAALFGPYPGMSGPPCRSAVCERRAMEIIAGFLEASKRDENGVRAAALRSH